MQETFRQRREYLELIRDRVGGVRSTVG